MALERVYLAAWTIYLNHNDKCIDALNLTFGNLLVKIKLRHDEKAINLGALHAYLFSSVGGATRK